MGRKGKAISLSLSTGERETLEKIAFAFGQIRGNTPNISGLVRAICSGELKLVLADDRDCQNQKKLIKKSVSEALEILQSLEEVL